MPKTRTLLALVLLPLLVFLVACGGDDDDGGGSGDQPAATDPASSGSGGAASGGASAGGGGSGAGGSADASTILGNCPELLNMFGAFSAGTFANPGTGNAVNDLSSLVDILQNAADNAPSEIQADMRVLAGAFAAYFSALAEIGVDFSNPASFAALDGAQLAQLQAATEAFGSAEVEQASDNLDTWFTENCG